ncbi:MAG: class I SAM-dependent methyltransferase [Gemmatimonadaceae bacterium]|nr:class I SAM-dependent methyltransferase [Gemmatimonadaceae bacterium]
MSLAATLDQVESLYSQNLRTNGTTPAAVGWNSPESQRLRFSQLTKIVQPSSVPITVNDYGCGYGAQLSYMVEDAGVPVSAYYGYDLSASMIEAARASLAPLPVDVQLRQSATVDTIADYSFVSGTFNVRFEQNEETWIAYIQDTLQQLAKHSRRGVAFNLLSTYVDWHAPNLYYADPSFWFDYCKRHLSKRVTLLHDYPLYEWTILVRTDGQ